MTEHDPGDVFPDVPCPVCGADADEAGPCGTCGLMFADCYGDLDERHDPVTWAAAGAGVPPLYGAGDRCPRCFPPTLGATP